MRPPKWLYQLFSFQREPVWILVISLLLPLMGIVWAVIIPALRK
jgi:hypothetical protein